MIKEHSGRSNWKDVCTLSCAVLPNLLAVNKKLTASFEAICCLCVPKLHEEHMSIRMTCSQREFEVVGEGV